ncbi:hypothetical protein [Parafannyhessea umbonata]|uniref:Uncharacterized protein n=1 Tax=Parafannyhessea umbonata TaxID=604330 RepID=A0A1H6IMQ7_9ACTN|nr:hypothetical protein [Parafannyhessea umbonata]SEH47547.1 hypothetical protein SAMN05216447_10367 [Parafannyhessea umbonata]
MSLIDTINAAKKEAEGNSPLSADSEKNATENKEAKQGFSKKSVAKAKPAREAADGVRVVKTSGGKVVSSGKAMSEMSKEEKKAARAAQREKDDLRMSATHVLLTNTKGYRRSQRVWWTLLGIGLASTVASWAIGQFVPGVMEGTSSPMGILMIVLMVLAYAVIIAAFIYDWRIVRPMRKAAEVAAQSMSGKKMSQVLKEDAREAAKEQSQKDRAKAARRSVESGRHEQHK